MTEAAASGRLHSITLFVVSDGRYQVSVSADRKAWRVEIDADPVKAILRAMGEQPAPQPSIGAFD
jgi:hypothetical protein